VRNATWERNKNSRLEKLVTEIMGLGYFFVMTFLFFIFSLGPFIYLLNMTFLVFFCYDIFIIIFH
jgi:hypothetical protein